MRRITKENIDSVDTAKCLYAFADSDKEIVAMNYIATTKDYHFTYQSTVNYGGWSNKIPTELIQEMLDWGYKVQEFTNEAEYHKWALEQLTGVEWVQKVPSAGDDIIYGPGGKPKENNKLLRELTERSRAEEATRVAEQLKPPRAGPPPPGYDEREKRMAEATKKAHAEKESQDENEGDDSHIWITLCNIISRLSKIELDFTNHVNQTK